MSDDIREQAPAAPEPPGRAAALTLQPRLIRMRDAPRYLGMTRDHFNALVRPHVTEIPFGRQCIAFDRLELDGWTEDYKKRCGRPVPPVSNRRSTWDVHEHRGSSRGAKSGGLRRKSEAMAAFEKALESATSNGRRKSSTTS
jgi:hypothetical protein